MNEKRDYELSDGLKAKIEKALAEARKRYEASREYRERRLAPLIQAIEETERLSEEDYRIYFNVR